jgi:hypothetical protein
VQFVPATALAFNGARGETFVNARGRAIAPLVTPFVRLNLEATTINAANSQGGLYQITWLDKVYGPAEPFRLNTADPSRTEAAVMSSLDRRREATQPCTLAQAATALGGTTTEDDLIAIEVPFTVENTSFDRPVCVVARDPAATKRIVLGSGLDTATVRVDSADWVPGTQLIFVEETSPGVWKPTFDRITLECNTAVGTRSSCNPLAISSPGATGGFITTEPGTVQSFLFNPRLTTAQQFAFTVTAQRSGTELATACTAQGGNTTVCASVKRGIKDVRVVPNPYVVISNAEPAVGAGLARPILFTHVPARGTIRIYTVSGQFVQQLTWVPSDLNETGDLSFDLRTREGNLMAGGLYLFVITGKDSSGRDLGSHMGKFVVIR